MTAEANANPNDFTKVLHPFDRPRWEGGRHMPVFVKVEYKGGRLSLTGVEGPTVSGNALGSCGQINMHYIGRRPSDSQYPPHVAAASLRYAPGWNADKWLDLLDIWERWHLNDTQPNCEHQTGEGWNTGAMLTLTPLEWGAVYHQDRRKAEAGQMPEAEYRQWGRINKIVTAASITYPTPKHADLWTEDMRDLITRGYLKEGKPKQERAGWVYPQEHPAGLLTKPCPECGYQYGSAWRAVAVPAETLAWLQALPDTDRHPHWV